MATTSVTSSTDTTGLIGLGKYSGVTLDVINQLIAADSGPITIAKNQISTINAQQNAWSSIQSSLTSLFNDVQTLQSNDTFTSKQATSSDSNSATVSATVSAAEGSYQLQIEQLATATKMTGTQVATTSNKTALNLTGKLTLTNSASGDQALTVDISATDSLNDIVAAINNQRSTSGITASVIDRHLVLNSNRLGAQTISVSDDSQGQLTANLGLDAKATTVKGQVAKFSIDGLSMTRDTNTVDDVVDGTTFELKQVTGDNQTVTLGVTNDTSKLTNAVQSFVKQYNTTMTLINNQMAVGTPGTAGNTTGTLTGNDTLIQLQTSLQNLINSSSISGTSLRPADLGISIADRYGTLSLDTAKLTTQLAKNPDSVKNFFFQGSTSDSQFAVTLGKDDTTDKGYTVGLSNLINRYITSSSTNVGVITTMNQSFTSQIKDLNSQITNFQTLLDQKKENYINTYTKLDTIIMNAQSKLSYLDSQTKAWSSSN